MVGCQLRVALIGLLLCGFSKIAIAQGAVSEFHSSPDPSAFTFTVQDPSSEAIDSQQLEISRLTTELAEAQAEIARLMSGSAPSGQAAGAGGGAGDGGGSGLAAQSQNPIADLVSLPLQSNFDFGLNPENRTRYIGNLQPVIPIKLNENWNLINRFIVPFSNVPIGPDARVDGIGDTFGQFFFSPRNTGVLTWGIGPSVIFPTSNERALGVGEWGVGVDAVALVTKDRIVAGFLINQVWTAQGSSKPFLFQPFFNYNFEKGWFFAASGEFASDWEQPDPTRWSIPVGVGIGRVFPILGQPVNINTRFAPYLDGPPGGPDWQFRLNTILLFPK